MQDGMSFPPIYLAKTIRGLAESGYKNYELYAKMIDKLIHNKEGYGTDMEQGFKVFSGFIDNQTFKQHIATLLAWKIPKSEENPGELDNALDRLTQEVLLQKGLQHNFASSLVNTSRMYHQIIQAQHNYQSIRNDQNITELIWQLQESLVKAGIVNPTDFDDINNFIDMDKIMQRAEKAFTGIVQKSFPYLKVPLIDYLYKLSEWQENHNLPDQVKLDLPDPNIYNINLISDAMLGLQAILNLGKSAEDGANAYVRDQAQGYQAIAGNHSKYWDQIVRSLQFLKERALEKIDKADGNQLCEILYGTSLGKQLDQGFLGQIEKQLNDKLTSDIKTELLVKALYGLGFSGKQSQLAPKIAQLIVQKQNDWYPSTEQIIQCIWSLSVLELQNSQEFNMLYQLLVDQDLDEDLKPQSQEQLFLIDQTVKTYNLDVPMISHVLIQQIQRYKNTPKQTVYDPVKEMIVPIIRLIANRGIDEQIRNYQDQRILAYGDQIDFKPDDFVSYNFQLVPIFAVSTDCTNLADQSLLGMDLLKHRLLKLQGYNPLVFPLQKLVKQDKSTIKLVENLNIVEWMEEQLGQQTDQISQFIPLISDVLKITKNKQDYSLKRFQDMLAQLVTIQSESQNNPEQSSLDSAIEDIKLQLFKISSAYDKLQQIQKKQVDSVLSKHIGQNTFQQALQQINQQLKTSTSNKVPTWAGIRQNIETLRTAETKNISTEMINHNFLWYKDYHHYDDWKQLICANYKPAKDMLLHDTFENEYLFFGRRQMYGKLPDSNITQGETALIVNLQNLKYELKRNFQDGEILDGLLNRDFVQQLLLEYNNNSFKENQKLIKRNFAAFQKFIKEVQEQSKNIDPFIKYFQKLHAKKQLAEDLFEQVMTEYNQILYNDELSAQQKFNQRSILISKYMNTEDLINHDSLDRDFSWGQEFIKNQFDVQTDPELLFSKMDYHQEDLDANNGKLDKYFLSKKFRAQIKFIKMKILYNLCLNKELNDQEKVYLKKWMSQLQRGNIHDAGNIMHNSRLTSLLFSDLTENDLKFFNQFNSVNIDQNDYSLNELILELSHFLDDSFIKRFELLVMESNQLNDWGITTPLDGSSKLDPTLKNKETWLLSQAFNEYQWRKAFQYNEEDKQNIAELYKTQLEKSYIGRKLWKLDQQNLQQAIDTFNPYDQRQRFLKQWYRLKEAENQQKQRAPSGQFNRTDNELRQEHLNQIKSEHQKQLSEFLNQEYDHMTSQSLNIAINNILELIRNNQFTQNSYYNSLIQSIFYHPKLKPRQAEEFETFLKYFGIFNQNQDWLFENPVKPFGSKLTDEISNEDWLKKFTDARGNFIGKVIAKAQESFRN